MICSLLAYLIWGESPISGVSSCYYCMGKPMGLILSMV